MLCASNDTTLVGYRLACSEKTSPDENSNLWWKSWNIHSHKVNTINWTETFKWYFYDVLCFQWHHTRLILTRLFREDLSRRKQQFLVKPMKYICTQSERKRIQLRPSNGVSMMFCDSNGTTLAWHGPPVPKDISRRKQQFRVKPMKYIFTQSKRDAFNRYPLVVLLWRAALPITPHSSDMDLPVPRRPLPTKTSISGQCHEIHNHTK